ncbi:hypothetical protein GCM10022631_04690 [Deinococcus rubellus]|uniref:Holliday junction resolvase n=1 Tax=Deinococcus rubellus TaxID=1889240 RepID=A0ABY5YK84_9DEIO|nr:hypothetical protein [Deinococcus rubellus]UWX64178.1 hypothetical protein N0D28_00405 [Deinococcus rubellus]
MTRQQIASASVGGHSSGGRGESTPGKKPVNSRRKGADGEREFAHALADAGFPATRGQQHAGGADSPDVRCEALAWIHFEVKRLADCKMFSPAQIREWAAQARRDAGPAKLPVLAHRWNGQSTWWIRVLPTDYRLPYWQTLSEFLTDVVERASKP